MPHCLLIAGQEKAKVKKTVDLFGGDDEEGDIFSESSRAPPPLQSKKEVVDEQVKQAAPEKKVTRLLPSLVWLP